MNHLGTSVVPPAQCPECGGHQLTTTAVADCQQTVCLDEYRVGCQWSRAMWSEQEHRRRLLRQMVHDAEDAGLYEQEPVR